MSRVEGFGQLRQREPRVRDKAHMGKIARLPCVACLARRGQVVRGVHVAHIRCGYPEAPGWRSVGAGEKPSDTRTAPLCPSCHLYGADGQHPAGDERTWWERLGIYPPAFCAALVEAFNLGTTGLEVVHKFAAEARKACARP